ncbi:MAG: SUMF1/EgtB/PvdO family nonheme iron enzyme [Planctomycetota bacterium]|nr:SUMF1/EgtB/PvdO family nonheme iron enzyme [Planctomycetota bacterium]
MPNKTTLALSAAVFVAAFLLPSCGSGPVQPQLEVLQPKSGGELVLLPAGPFVMGDKAGRPDETPHTVSVSSFYIDRHPVTQEFYQRVMDANPSKRRGAKNPVEQLKWTEAARFCNKCSELDGLTPCYDEKTWGCNLAADGYRLPTEAEWEYACRAGSTTQYCYGDDPRLLPQYAWLAPQSGGTPRPVGQKLPNRWGLYDMHGNVWQWCNDYYAADYYKESPQEDPTGPKTGDKRVLRGGAWDCPPERCRAGYRFKEFPTFGDVCEGYDSYAFRRVKNPVKSAASSPYPLPQGERGTAAPPSGAGTATATPPQTPPAKTGQEKTAAPPPTPPSRDAGKLDPARLTGTLVFVSERGGSLDIWRMHASGARPKQLTNDGQPHADPRFSPDGKRIMYTVLRGGFPEVWLMNRDGSEPKAVTKGAQADWSPDSKAIIFIRDKQAYVRDLAAASEKRVTPEMWERCTAPAWSPDGTRFAVSSRHLAQIGIFILSFDGKENRQLKTEDPSCTPRWSHDGKRLLCQTVKGHVHQVGVDGANWDQITFGADTQHEPRYSPDGTMLLFCRGTEGAWQICVKRLDGDEMESVQLTTEGSNLLPDWHSYQEPAE